MVPKCACMEGQGPCRNAFTKTPTARLQFMRVAFASIAAAGAGDSAPATAPNWRHVSSNWCKQERYKIAHNATACQNRNPFSCCDNTSPTANLWPALTMLMVVEATAGSISTCHNLPVLLASRAGHVQVGTCYFQGIFGSLGECDKSKGPLLMTPSIFDLWIRTYRLLLGEVLVQRRLLRRRGPQIGS